jgi:hypothetical protein
MWSVVTKFGANGPESQLRVLDTMTNELWDGSVTPAAQTPVDFAPCANGKLVVADQTTAAPGLRVYEGPIEKTTAALPFGLAPGSSHGLVCY